jgi:hypothetical protein
LVLGEAFVLTGLASMTSSSLLLLLLVFVLDLVLELRLFLVLPGGDFGVLLLFMLLVLDFEDVVPTFIGCGVLNSALFQR